LSSHLQPKNAKIRIYQTAILPVVPYWCETLSLPLRQEHRLRVFESRVLRRIFGPKRGDMMGGWRNLHSEELCDLYPSPNIIRNIKLRRMRWAGHMAQMGEKMNVYRLLVGKPERRRPLGRTRLVNAIMNNRVIQNALKLLSGYRTDGLLNSAQLHRVSYFVLVKKKNLS
jgi:hypothetical protein